MHRGRILLGLAILALLTLLSACNKEKAAQLVDDIGVGEYTDTTLEFPLLSYSNGQVTINDRCPVRKVSLNRRLTPLFVNGQPLGFC